MPLSLRPSTVQVGSARARGEPRTIRQGLAGRGSIAAAGRSRRAPRAGPTQRSAARTVWYAARPSLPTRTPCFRGLGTGTGPANAPLVTLPRRVLPGATYLVTRRCTQRQFLLKPSALINQVFKFVLATAAARYKIRIHAACVMSNHYHLVVTDPRANLPEFARVLDGVLAKALNLLYDRRENFWAPSSYSAVELTSPDDVVEKVAYTLANPTTAGLVERGRQWPGVWSNPRSLGKPGEIVERPTHYFTDDGTMPERAVLTYSRPPGFASLDAFLALVMARLEDLEEVASAERAAKGLRVAGVRRVLNQRHTDGPASVEPRRALDPRIASMDRRTRIEVLDRLAHFFESHREALLRYLSGKRNVLFPHGTYLMRVRFGVACASS